MNLKFNQFYSKYLLAYLLIGLISILLIIIVQNQRPDSEGMNYFVILILGILPNFITALGFPFLLLILFEISISFTNRLKQWIISTPRINQTRIFIISILLIFSGLLVYEFMQIFIYKQTFDVYDIWATFFGSYASYWLFRFVCKQMQMPDTFILVK